MQKRGPYTLLIGDNRATLRTLPAGSVQMCVTSPPYFALRSYLDAEHPAKALEIGSEPTPEQFIATMVEVFREVRRVLRDDGTLFVNLGDSYDQGKKGASCGVDVKQEARRFGVRATENGGGDAGAGQLLNIPHRVAEALRADGWIWRQTIVWAKKSPMPESVSGWHWQRCRVKVAANTNHDSGKNGDHVDRRKVGFNDRYDNPDDHSAKWSPCPGCPKCEANSGWVLRRGKGRCTTAHEYVFIFSKSETYFWDSQASKEPTTGNAHSRGNGTTPKSGHAVVGVERNNDSFSAAVCEIVTDRNPRTVWTLSSEPTKEKHFATFPSELARRCIVAGASAGGCCPHCGSPWAPMLTKERVATRPAHVSKTYIDPEGSPYAQHNGSVIGNRDPERHTTTTACHGYRQTCGCPALEAVPCKVLDPFSGLATTGQTACFLGHEYIGCELNPEYGEMSERRLVEPPRWWLRQQAHKPKSKRRKKLKQQRALFE